MAAKLPLVKKISFYIAILINIGLIVAVVISTMNFIDSKKTTLKNGVKVQAQILSVHEEHHKYWLGNGKTGPTKISTDFYIDIHYEYKNHPYAKSVHVDNFDTYSKYSTKLTTTATLDRNDPKTVYIDGSLAPDSLYFLGGFTFAYTFAFFIIWLSILLKKKRLKAITA